MKKILVLLFLLLSSCTTDIFSGSEFTGRKGLNFYFDYDSPPKYVYEETGFPIKIIIENAGASDVKNGLYVVGFENQYVYIEKNTGSIDLFGKSTERPYGDKTELFLQGDAKKLGGKMEGLTTTLSLNACYEYNTKAGITTCIDANPSSKKKKVCSVSPQSFNAGQAAPIGVTSVVPRMIVDKTGGVRPQYEIIVENLDGGGIISPEYVKMYCAGKSMPKEFYNVINAEIFLNQEQLICTKTSLELKDGSDKIICELPRIIPSIEGSYYSPLVINLNYGYAQTITKQLRIQSKK